jgi:predicted PurR-regulated permease PerM
VAKGGKVMTVAEQSSPPETPKVHTPLPAPELLKKLAIWTLFFVVLYLARSFFFVAFMTFLFSYLTLILVGWGMKRLSPGKESPGLRRILTLGVFVVVPVVLVGVGSLVAPPLLDQVQRLAGQLSHLNLESEVSHLLEGMVGPAEFKQSYGSPGDPRYQKGLEEFRHTGVLHVEAYNQFPKLEAWVEGAFNKQFTDAERGQIRQHLLHEGVSSKAFEEWFLTKKVPALQEQALKEAAAAGGPSTPLDALVRAAASDTPDQLLNQVRRDPTLVPILRQQWVQDVLEHEVAAARHSHAYQVQFKEYYEQQRAKAPHTFPYTFEQYVELRDARPQGQVAFGKVLEKIQPTAAGEAEARLRADFEAAKKHELFQQWWRTSSVAQFVRHHLEGNNVSGAGSGQLDRIFAALVSIPMDLGTALLLSLFICIDFPRLQSGMRRLRETWLKDVYDEIAPALTSLAHLVGRAMFAQGLIALCNAVMMYFVLYVLGMDHVMLLSAATFVLCLVPTLGAVLAWALIAVCALLQPGGGFVLALKASGGVLFVMLMEVFVFSPRILGKAMELHPVLIMALLPIAQFFFGIWGLILATPVAVYVIYVVIFRRGLPGSEQPPKASAEGASATGRTPSPDSANATKEEAVAR